MSEIKATREQPGISVVHYPEAIYRLHQAYIAGDELERDVIAFTIAHIYAREKAVVTADLARGVP